MNNYGFFYMVFYMNNYGFFYMVFSQLLYMWNEIINWILIELQIKSNWITNCLNSNRIQIESNPNRITNRSNLIRSNSNRSNSIRDSIESNSNLLQFDSIRFVRNTNIGYLICLWNIADILQPDMYAITTRYL